MIYRFKGLYHFLSNFYPCEIEYQGVKYASVEHAYQAMKSELPEWREFCTHPDVSAAMTKVKSRDLILGPEWTDERRVSLMRELVTIKFTTNENLKALLLETYPQNILEGNYHDDTFFGVDLKSNPNYGENWLGRILMEVREKILCKT